MVDAALPHPTPSITTETLQQVSLWHHTPIEACTYDPQHGCLWITAAGVHARVATFDDAAAAQIAAMCRLAPTYVDVCVGTDALAVVATSGSWQYWVSALAVALETPTTNP
jgi:hypothetical protein